jgi:2',3'-cyclic-nucleotide 2'-phosphodiesterase (5'-nucleotidase family)
MRHLVILALGGALAACVVPPPSQTPLPGMEAGPPSTVELLVASTTDVHGRLRGWDYYDAAPDTLRGLARAATIVDSLRQAAPGRVLLVDAGDLLQGNPLTYVAARVSPQSTHPVIAAMNAMAYDAAAIGNHEFNYGLGTLSVATGRAQFPFLATNVYQPNGSRAFQGTAVVERGGVRVGIIGATTPGSNLWDRDKLRGRVEVRDVIPEVRKAVDEVKRAGVDAIVVLLHSGLSGASSYDTVLTGVGSENVAAQVAHDVPGIDLIVYGHSHRQMADTTINGTLLVQPRNWATSVGVAHLTLVRQGDRYRVTAKRGELVPTAGHAESETVLEATRAGHEAALAYVSETIGTTSTVWRADSARVKDTPLIDFMLEVERRTTGADLASTAAFSTDATLGPGAITVAQVAKLYPYENTLKMVRLSGRQLREYLEYSARYFGTAGTTDPAVDPEIPGYNFDIVSGADYTIDVSKPIGSRITTLAVNGTRVADTDTFTLAVNNYRQSGGGGYAMLRGAPVVYDGQTEIRQLLIDEVKRLGRIEPADVFRQNWSLLPGTAVSAAYDAMHRGGPVSSGGEPPALRRLRIIATNDFHGALEPRPDARGVRRGGAAALATAILDESRNCTASCAVLLVDGGDMWQGTPASNLAYGRPVVRLYNLLGYDAAALGNHEFDWTVDTLRARMREARFRIMGANVKFADGTDVPWIPDDTLLERNGIKVGLIGVSTTETPTTTRPQNVRGLRFDDPAPIVDAHARALRARGADAIVVLAHIGAFCDSSAYRAACHGDVVELAQRLTEKVDAIVAGHTHSRMEPVINGIPIVQSYSSGTALGIVDVPLGAGAPTIRVRNIYPDSVPAEPRVDSLVRVATGAVAGRVSERVLTVPVDLPRRGNQYALGNLIADAQRWAGKADIAVMNNGGIRADLRQGPATYGSLFEIQPFGNQLVRLRVRGSDLRSYLEKLVDAERVRSHVSGIEVRYDSTKPPGRRIVSVTTEEGRPINNLATYTIVMSDFLVSGGDGLGLGTAALQSDPLGIVDLDALIGYLRTRGDRLVPPTAPRIIAVSP